MILSIHCDEMNTLPNTFINFKIFLKRHQENKIFMDYTLAQKRQVNEEPLLSIVDYLSTTFLILDVIQCNPFGTR